MKTTRLVAAVALALWPAVAIAALQAPVKTTVTSGAWTALSCGVSAPSTLIQNLGTARVWLAVVAAPASTDEAIALDPGASPQIPGRGTWYAKSASGSQDVRCMGIQP